MCKFVSSISSVIFVLYKLYVGQLEIQRIPGNFATVMAGFTYILSIASQKISISALNTTTLDCVN